MIWKEVEVVVVYGEKKKKNSESKYSWLLLQSFLPSALLPFPFPSLSPLFQ